MICPEIPCESGLGGVLVERISSFPAYGFRSRSHHLDCRTA